MKKQHVNKASFYDSQWKEWNDMIQYSPAPRFRRAKIISWLRQLRIDSLLDVGCGNGEFLAYVNNEIPKLQLAGVDIAAEQVTVNRLQMPDFKFETLDINKDVLSEQYDAVACMEVIEHCTADLRDVIARLAKMTKQWLLITVPCGPIFEIDRRVGHIKHLTAEEIQQALSNAGMKVVKLQRWGFPFFNLYKHVINLAPDTMCETFLSSEGYSRRQKVLASMIYTAFKLSVPWRGYQMFVLASR